MVLIDEPPNDRTLPPPRFFIGSDDVHKYIVPVEHRDDWYAWEALLMKDEETLTEPERHRTWGVPHYARRVNRSGLTFAFPQSFD